jgi:tetratricopeptide (TPR) repeat protein
LILSLAALIAAQASAPPADPRLRSCTALIRTAPDRAAAEAETWASSGGGVSARQCLGMALSAQERWAPAATAFEQGARDAEAGLDARRADLWVQAGNAWVAGGEPARAVLAFDSALLVPGISDTLRGQVHLDRARAMVAQNNNAGARTDINRALELTPSDPTAWYLSAALARRQRDLVRAQADIARALELAPQEPGILLLAGTIAGLSGNAAEAERLYRRVVQIAPASEAGQQAQAALATITETELPAPPPPAEAQPAPQPR